MFKKLWFLNVLQSKWSDGSLYFNRLQQRILVLLIICPTPPHLQIGSRFLCINKNQYTKMCRFLKIFKCCNSCTYNLQDKNICTVIEAASKSVLLQNCKILTKHCLLSRSSPQQFDAVLLGATQDPLCTSRPLSTFCIFARICICSQYQLPQRGRDPYLHTEGQTFAAKCKQATDANWH